MQGKHHHQPCSSKPSTILTLSSIPKQDSECVHQFLNGHVSNSKTKPTEPCLRPLTDSKEVSKSSSSQCLNETSILGASSASFVSFLNSEKSRVNEPLGLSTTLRREKDFRWVSAVSSSDMQPRNVFNLSVKFVMCLADFKAEMRLLRTEFSDLDFLFMSKVCKVGRSERNSQSKPSVGRSNRKAFNVDPYVSKVYNNQIFHQMASENDCHRCERVAYDVVLVVKSQVDQLR